MHPHVSLSNKCGMRPCSRVTRLKLSFICPYLFLRPMFMSNFCYVDALHLTAKREFHAKHFYLSTDIVSVLTEFFFLLFFLYLFTIDKAKG